VAGTYFAFNEFSKIDFKEYKKGNLLKKRHYGQMLNVSNGWPCISAAYQLVPTSLISH
jgi:hypothetical protein